MPNIRAIRRDHGLSVIELALASGVPTRTLSAIEHGLLQLDNEYAVRLAPFLGLSPDQLLRPSAALPDTSWRKHYRVVSSGAVMLVSGILLFHPLVRQQSDILADTMPTVLPTIIPTVSPTGAPLFANVGDDTVLLRELLATSVPTLVPSPESTLVPSSEPTPEPTLEPTPKVLFWIDQQGPHGCPVVISQGQVVITQGFDEGSHVPSQQWGGVDLASDLNGDGFAEPGATYGASIVAMHAGIARVYPDTWPGGNIVIVEDAESGWSTLYGHLAQIDVQDGQIVEAGSPLGLVGSTGMSSGPHLHYELRTAQGNVDPTPLLTCE